MVSKFRKNEKKISHARDLFFFMCRTFTFSFFFKTQKQLMKMTWTFPCVHDPPPTPRGSVCSRMFPLTSFHFLCMLIFTNRYHSPTATWKSACLCTHCAVVSTKFSLMMTPLQNPRDPLLRSMAWNVTGIQFNKRKKLQRLLMWTWRFVVRLSTCQGQSSALQSSPS